MIQRTKEFFKKHVGGFLDGLMPVKRISVTAWSNLHRHLSPVSASEPGRYRSSRTPYMEQIMDDLSDGNAIQEVIFMKAAQVGATEVGLNWIGYVIDVSPGPTIIVWPTDDVVKKNSKVRIKPMIEATPRLRDKIAKARSRDSGNTIQSKDFPGGFLIMVGSNSPSGLRSLPVKNILLDEVDAYPLSAGDEGSPVDLARARAKTFPKRKIASISTPTREGTSVIAMEFAETDQRHYHVPCPHCGTLQDLVFENLVYVKGSYDDVRYRCAHCEDLIHEKYKGKMLKYGRWIAHAPEKASKIKTGYHINSLYSPPGWFSWGECAKQYEDAQGNEEKLMVFENTVKGLTYKQSGERPDFQRLHDKRESYERNKPQKEVCFITAGVDVQGNRLEMLIEGWGKGKRSYNIDYRVFPGSPTDLSTWAGVKAALEETWVREDGIEMQIKMMAIDSGYSTTAVYDFCQMYSTARVIPVKGQENQSTILASPRQVNVTRGGKKIGALKNWNVGVSIIKRELYAWFKQDKLEDGTKPPGYCTFPEYDLNFFKGITAEVEEIVINKKGQRTFSWVKKIERNEPLDTKVYSRAAAHLIGIDRFKESDYEKQAGTYVKKSKPKEPKEKGGGSFW